MTFTRIDIGENVRKKMCAVLNQRLAECIDLAAQCKQAHWNVKGHHFIGLHELFDTFNAQLLPQVDELAERITALGGVAHGTVQAVSKATELEAYPVDIKAGDDHLKSLGGGFAKFAENIRGSIDEAEELEDKDTADLFVDVSRIIDKSLWMIDAHLEKNA